MSKENLIFLLLVSAVTLLLSYFTAYIYTKAIPMDASVSRAVRIAGLVFPFLFIAANTLSRSAPLSQPVRWLYGTLSVGGGIAFYLLLGAILLGLLLLVFSFKGALLPPAFSYAILALSLILAGLGFYQSRTLIVVRYNVSVLNLPESWHGKEVALISDTHYGLLHHHGAARRLVDRLISLQPDLVLMAGDLFDGPAMTTDNLALIWRDLAVQTPVYYAPGNHESYGDYGAFMRAAQDFGFVVLEDAMVVHDGVSILGLGYRGKGGKGDVTKSLHTIAPSSDQMLLAISHAPLFHEEIQNAGVDLLVSGHSHRGQFWPIRYITKAIYGDYHYGHHRYRDMHAITTSGVGTAAVPMRLFNPPEIVVLTFVQS